MEALTRERMYTLPPGTTLVCVLPADEKADVKGRASCLKRGGQYRFARQEGGEVILEACEIHRPCTWSWMVERFHVKYPEGREKIEPLRAPASEGTVVIPPGWEFAKSLRKMNQRRQRDPYEPVGPLAIAHRACLPERPLQGPNLHGREEKVCVIAQELEYRVQQIGTLRAKQVEAATAWARRQKNHFGVCSTCQTNLAPRAFWSMCSPEGISFTLDCAKQHAHGIFVEGIDPDQFPVKT